MKLAANLLQYLPLCSYHNIFNGTWTIAETAHLFVPYQSCPNTHKVAKMHQLHYSEKHYSCNGKMVKPATYEGSGGCHILPIREAAEVVASFSPANNISIIYVGDSLAMQLTIASMCSAETFNNIPNVTHIDHRTELIQDSYLRDVNWQDKLPPNVTAVMLGAGAWYNNVKGDEVHTYYSIASYTEMLTMLGPIASTVKQIHGAEVFWVGLPPAIIRSEDIANKSTSFYYKYEWSSYTEKNRLAKEILEPFGVHYIDVDMLTRYRKEHDWSVTVDGQHWW